jgi:NDP-sugar pyrophosphorylase family protein
MLADGMQAVILAGGRGTRLRPYTTVIPKPLMPVGDMPILEIILRQLRRAGVRRVILACGYMAQMFQAFFQDGARLGLAIEYSFEEKALGTAGPLALALDRLDEHFIVMNGDLLTTLDYRALFDGHVQSGAAATIGLYTREVTIDFGVIETAPGDRLAKYLEKPVYRFDVSMGANVLTTSKIRSRLRPGEHLDIPQLMTQLVAGGETVRCHRSACYWLDIGRGDDYELANEIFASRRAEFLPDDEAPR